MNRKILSTALASILIGVLFAVAVNGAVYPSTYGLASGSYKDVQLSANERIDETGTVGGTYKYYDGYVASGSNHKVWFRSYYKSGNKYLEERADLCNKNTNLGKKTTTTRTRTEWKLELNSQLLYLNCDAYGFIWYNL